MTKLHQLTNPNGSLVESAWISETMMGATLNVDTINGNRIEGYRTLRGAKNAFGRNYQIGGKWKTNEQH